MQISRFDVVEGSVSDAAQARDDVRAGVPCEVELRGDSFDCDLIHTGTAQDGLFIDYLVIHDACETGRFCEDGSLTALTIVHEVVEAGPTTEVVSEVWLTDTRRQRRSMVGTLNTIGEADGSMVFLDVDLFTDEWTDLGEWAVDRSSDPTEPDAMSWETTVSAALAGAGVGATFGPGGALAGALNATAISMALQIYDDNKEKDSDGDGCGEGDGETDGGGATEGGGDSDEGGDVKSDTDGTGTCDVG